MDPLDFLISSKSADLRTLMKLLYIGSFSLLKSIYSYQPNVTCACAHLLPPLCRHNDVKLVGAVHWGCKPAGSDVIGGANVGYHVIEDDICVFLHGPQVVRQTHEESDILWYG